jgi:hypothetical protein
MERTVQRVFVGLAIMLLVGLAVAGTSDLERERPGGSEERGPANRPFKMNAAGQINLSTGAIMFGGVASHLGLYTANGFLNPNDFSIFGTIEAANGDTLEFVASFTIGQLGELQAAFEIDGGTGRFADAVGTASGPVTLEPDFSFVIRATGNLGY